MKEFRCEITLPEKIVSFLGIPKKELGAALQKELAIHFFESGCLGFGQARQLAGMSVWSFIELMDLFHRDDIDLVILKFL